MEFQIELRILHLYYPDSAAYCDHKGEDIGDRGTKGDFGMLKLWVGGGKLDIGR